MRPRFLPLVVLALLLAGCAQSDGGGVPGTTPTGATPTPTAPTPAEEPPRNDSAPPVETPAADVAATFARDRLNATAGHVVSFPLTLENAGGSGAQVEVLLQGGDLEGRLDAQALPAGEAVTVFVPVEVPEGAEHGIRFLSLVLVDAEGRELLRQEKAATLEVLEAAAGYAPGDVARVLYVGRLADSGLTFNTNDPALQDLDFPRTETYRFSPGGGLEVRSLPRPSVVEGFYEGILGMVPGESRTITFPPEKGYGNDTIEERIPREDVVERRQTVPIPESAISRDAFEQFLLETGQGSADDYAVGDLVYANRSGQQMRYRVMALGDDEVRLRLHVQVDERYTLYDAWPNGSVIENVTEQNVTFRTTPTTPEGEPFTYHPHWPGLSVVASLNETAIVVRHDPPVGLQYTTSAARYRAPSEYTVRAVGEKEILVTTPSANPLAGETLTFDVLLLEIERGDAA